MPAPTFNKTTASASSGDINIALAPQAVNDLLLVFSSAWQTSGHPTGWALTDGGLWTKTSTGTTLETFDQGSVNPGPMWNAVFLDLLSISSPALEQNIFVDFGTYPTGPYNHTFSGGNVLNAGDAIIWQFCGQFVGPVTCSATDTQGNTYNSFLTQTTVGGKNCVSCLLIAFGAQAGSCVTTFNVSTPQVSGQGFDINLNVWSGLAVPSPPVPPISNVVLNFQDPSGGPLAFGYVELRLSQDASAQFAGGPQIAAGRLVTVPLDATGTCIANIRPTEGLLPAVTYQAQAFTAHGQPVWRGNLVIALNQPSYILLEDGTLIYLETGGGSAILTES